MRVYVEHAAYGCDTGCCGHLVLVEAAEGETAPEPNPHAADRDGFAWTHPYLEDHLEWARALVAEVYGPEHVADLDWDRCAVWDDDS